MSTNLRIKHHRLNGGSLVSLSGSDIAGGCLNLGAAHQCGDGEGVKARLAEPRSECGAQVMPHKTRDTSHLLAVPKPFFTSFIGYVYRATRDDYPGSERAVKLVFDKLPGGWKVELRKVGQLELVDGVAHFHDLGAETITHRDDSHLCQYTVWDYIAPGENLKDYLSRVDSVPTSFLVALIERIVHEVSSLRVATAARP